MKRPEILIAPQEGPQTQFLSTTANIAIFGGAAGGGKTHALLLEPLRHYNNKDPISCVTFRRNMTEIKKPGGLWDKSMELYSKVGGTPLQHMAQWTFGNKLKIAYSHLEYDSTVYDWQGAEIPIIQFDELSHFSENQFWYMFSRNRSTSGVQGYVRATCNPISDHWLRKFVDWWIGEDGLPIKERSGVIRWFFRDGDDLVWADSKEDILKIKSDAMPKSVTFIASTVYDNKILLEKDPEYLANLKSLPRVERERLLGGNWNVRPAAGMYFRREFFDIVDVVPAGAIKIIRYWDRASTKPNETNSDPDYTVGLKIHYYKDGYFVISDIRRFRDTPMNVEKMIINTAKQDEPFTQVWIEQDPGQAGVADKDNYVRLLAGFNVRINRVTKDKVTRALPASAQAENRNIKILKAHWNDPFLSEVENFDGSGKGHDDQVDCLSGAVSKCLSSPSMFDVV